MNARERLPVGREDVRVRGGERPPRGASAGARERIPWNIWTRALAAARGHLEVLQWARENDCPWDEETCSNAALDGHLEVLQWARENGCPWNELTRELAASKGYVET